MKKLPRLITTAWGTHLVKSQYPLAAVCAVVLLYTLFQSNIQFTKNIFIKIQIIIIKIINKYRKRYKGIGSGDSDSAYPLFLIIPFPDHDVSIHSAFNALAVTTPWALQKNKIL